MNYNVRLSLWWTALENISGSVRSGDALSVYLYLLTKKNSVVGFIQGINGVLQLVVALPAGWLADRTRRDTVLRAGALVGVLGGAALAWSMVFAPTDHSAVSVAAAMALLGCYRGFYNPALEALFADSVEAGRTSAYTWRYVVMILSSGAGPLLSLFIFLRLGDSWTLAACRHVVLAGLLGMLPALCMMCFFDDDRALSHHHSIESNNTNGNPEQQRHHHQQQRQREGVMEPLLPATLTTATTSTLFEDAGAERVEEEMEAAPARGSSISANGGDIDTDTAPPEIFSSSRLLPPNGSTGTITNKMNTSAARWRRPAVAVPVLLTLSDVFGALASGMTIKFFSLFFMQRAGLSPVSVSLISTTAPLGVAAASVAAQRASKVFGRVQLSLVTRLIDIGLLVAMAYVPAGSARITLIAVHLVRMAAANCTRPLLRSVLNQFVPRRHRGKVNAVDSVRTFSWSGSAALGGILVEKLGFEGTFLVTAAVKVAAFIPLLFLVQFVPDGVMAGGRGAAVEAALQAALVVERGEGSSSRGERGDAEGGAAVAQEGEADGKKKIRG